MTQPHLDFGVTSSPIPLQTQEPGQISIVASYSGDGALDVSQLLFSVSIGGAADSLTNQATGLRALAGQGWQINDLGAGSFRATPASGTTVPITGQGVEFILSGFTVNATPGTTTVSIAETAIVDKAKSQWSGDYPLIKNAGPLTLTGPTAYPNSVDYGGSSVISWSATHGATIALDVDGTTIDHVKGQPGTPLPAVGSYTVENITRADAVVSCTAALNPGTGPQTKSGQVIIAMNDPAIETLTTSRMSGECGSVKASWTTKSAETVTLTMGEKPPKQVSPNGSSEVATTLWTSDVTLTVTNPVTTVTKTIPQPPTVTNWVRVADGPSLPADCRAQLFVVGDQIGLWADSRTTPSKLYLSSDGKNWHLEEGTPAVTPSWMVSPVLSTPTTTYFPNVVTLPQPAPDGSPYCVSLYRRDVASGTWSETSVISFTQEEVNTTCVLMAADPDGTIYAGSVTPGPGLFFKSQDDGETWTPLSTPNKPASSSLIFVFTALVWMDGALRLVGNKKESEDMLSVVWDPATGWTETPLSNTTLSRMNVQTSVVGDTLYMMPNPAEATNGLPLQLFKLTPDGAVTGFASAAGVEIKNSNVSINNIGFISFNGVFLACAPASILDGGGIWMFNQPDF